MNFGPGGPGGPGFGPGPRRPMEAGGGPGGSAAAPGRLPDNILAILSSKGVEKDGVKGFVLSDMSGDGDLCDCRVILTEDAVIILSVREELKQAPRGPLRFGRPKSAPVTTQTQWVWTALEEISGFFIEERTNGGSLCASLKNGDAIALCGFSMAKKRDCESFCAKLSEYLEKGEIKERGGRESFGEEYCPKCHSRYPDPSTKLCPHCMPRTKLFRRLLPFFKKYRFQIFITVVMIILGIFVGLLVPYLSNKVLYDRVLDPAGDLYGMIGPLVGAVILANLLSAFFEHLNSVVGARVSAGVIYDLKKTIFENLQRLSMSFFSGRHTGSLMTQVNGDAETLYWFFCDGVPYLITNLVKLAAVLVVMIVVDWRLALLVFVPLPLLALGYRAVMKGFSRLHAKSFANSRRFNSAVSDVLSGFRVVKAFSREDAEIERFDTQSISYADANLAVALRSNAVFPSINLAVNLGSLVIWAVGGWLVVQNHVSLGEAGITYASLMLFLSVMSYVSGPITFLGEFSGQLSRAINSMRRLFEVADTVPEVREKPDPVKKERLEGHIVFEGVGFSYEPGKKTVSDVSFEVKPGETLGIVGHTGAGKSTVANLMTRLYDVGEGSVKIDGVDVRDYSLDTLHSNVAIVSQETYLFRGSVMDNIRYACPDATREQVIAAARAAGAHDFIMKLPNGYNTVVDSQKNRLSGGETQRISIARAILKDPKILLLDEATSSMDTQTERLIQDSLDRLTGGKTTVIIAHRLSTLRNADRLVVIKDGKMIESGTHAELMRRDGEYRKLYTIQLEALKRVAVD